MPTGLKASLTPPPRLGSLDAYRGMVMIALAAGGFGIASTKFETVSWWPSLVYQFSHVAWVGCAFWDLIQPSFMFMVGVSLPFSYSGRMSQGHSWWQSFRHAAARAVILMFLGIFLRSQSGSLPNFTFMDVLTQIGLGYIFLFLLWNRPAWVQLAVALNILLAYWAWFAFTPLPGEDFDLARVTPKNFEGVLTGFAAHWQMNANPAAYFDIRFLNWFPREKPFEFEGGGYATLNFIPALVTMIFGLMTGEAIRGSQSKFNVVGGLLICALIGLVSGWLLDYFGVCPLVKRIWTPSWTLFSAGWCWLILAGFYAIIDGVGFSAWAFPLRVAGMNSIVLYVLGHTLRGWTAGNLQRWFSPITRYYWEADLFEVFGKEWEHLVLNNLVLLMFWLFVFWLYRQKLFVRI